MLTSKLSYSHRLQFFLSMQTIVAMLSCTIDIQKIYTSQIFRVSVFYLVGTF